MELTLWKLTDVHIDVNGTGMELKVGEKTSKRALLHRVLL